MSLLANSGIGMILVTHDLSDIVPEIDRVLLMAGGRIVADGRKQDMLRPERLAGLFGIEVELAQHNHYYHLW
jgi:iron complex transport system ATP-binding protein